MNYNFDEIIIRKGSNSAKYDALKEVFNHEGLLPMWVADMDFKVAEPIKRAIEKRMQKGIYGYTYFPDTYFKSLKNWLERRHNWKIKEDWILHSPGVVPALSMIVRNFTDPGDRVVIQPPVYYPFYEVVEKNNRELVKNPLKMVDGRYVMDYEDLLAKIDEKVKLILLCSPHNPGGRVWEREELKRLGEICLDNDILVVSDEIHQDLIFRGNTHIPFASISRDFLYNSITCTAPSKTFNIPGLKTSFVILPDKTHYNIFNQALETLHLSSNNTFGIVAAEAAYNEGDDWLDQLLKYLEGNLTFLLNYFEEEIPAVKPMIPEGTYLVWLDFSNLNLSREELDKLLLEEAEVALDPGHWFGEEGDGFMRINIACPRVILKEGLDRIKKAVLKIN